MRSAKPHRGHNTFKITQKATEIMRPLSYVKKLLKKLCAQKFQEATVTVRGKDFDEQT